MARQAGFYNKQIEVWNRQTASTDDFAVAVGGDYAKVCIIWANVSWTKGIKALREGAIDSYDYLMVRTRYHADLTDESRLKVDGKFYQIQSFHNDFHDNTTQATVVELRE